MRKLIDQLNKWTDAYNAGNPIVSDKEWDDMYFQLEKMEREANFAYPDSPTQKIHYTPALVRLEKVKHSHPMLSLAKTKDSNEIGEFISDKQCIAMLKLDGLTCSLKYDEGVLVGAETRGNGEIGDDILHNAKVIPSIPKKIKAKGIVVVDGEVICTKKNFKEFEEDYKNPRNFASGSIRLLSNVESAKRHLTFVAWDCVEGFDHLTTLSAKLDALDSVGFTTVPRVDKCDLHSAEELTKQADLFGYPIDGLVYKYDLVSEYIAAGRTEHHFSGGLAYKFYDEEYETRLIDIDWTMGRTGAITPVAMFAPIEIDGCTVERASLHNLSIMKELLGHPFVGQTLWIYKSNEIIPQVRRSLGAVDGELVQWIDIPTTCPICGGNAEQVEGEDTLTLMCTNPECEGKLINKLDHTFGKKGLDIKGLSKATFEKLVNWGWVSKASDVFNLKAYREEWMQKPGFGEKSVDRILEAIEIGRNPTLNSFICALGIPLIGRAMSKELIKHFNSYEEFKAAAKSRYNFAEVEGIAEEKMYKIWQFDFTEADALYECLESVASPTEEPTTATLEGQIVCITGKLHLHKNRSELQSRIEAAGGKATSSVSAKTSWLINNDINSTSSKNVSAQRLGIPIITEEEFVNQFFGV